jgi:hypothetical protein
MALEVVPGPLPEDGTRINVDRDLDRFINNTNVQNFGPEEFAQNEQINFVVSATSVPATDIRTPGMLWFKRGTGILYKWDAAQADDGIALWVAQSVRKEMVVKMQSGPAKLGSMVWLDRGTAQGPQTEYFAQQVGNNRMVMKVQATEMHTLFAVQRAYPMPPFLVALEDIPLTFPVTGPSSVGAGVFTTAVQLGYVPGQVGAAGPGAGIVQTSNVTDRNDAWIVSDTPLGYTNSWGAHVVGSGAPDSAGNLLVYVKGTPANVGW